MCSLLAFFIGKMILFQEKVEGELNSIKLQLTHHHQTLDQLEEVITEHHLFLNHFCFIRACLLDCKKWSHDYYLYAKNLLVGRYWKYIGFGSHFSCRFQDFWYWIFAWLFMLEFMRYFVFCQNICHHSLGSEKFLFPATSLGTSFTETALVWYYFSCVWFRFPYLCFVTLY